MGDKKTPAKTNPPRVFISYAWESPEYRAWVVSLATRMRDDGIDVRLDYWHLGEDPIPSFINREVRHADRVVVLCSPGLRDRIHAFEDEGKVSGGGWEAMLVMVRMFGQGQLKAAIPVLTAGAAEDSVPDFLAGFAHVDLSAEERFEEEYLELLRRLFGKLPTAPELGTAPDLDHPQPGPVGGPFEQTTGTRKFKVEDDTAQLLEYVVRNLDYEEGGGRLFRLLDAASTLGLDPDVVYKALEEALDLGLLAGELGPYAATSFQATHWLLRIPELRIHSPDEYQPRDDRDAVVLAVVDEQEIKGDVIQERTGLPDWRVSFAVDALEEDGVLDVWSRMGCAPYSFLYAVPTSATRRAARAIRRAPAQQPPRGGSPSADTRTEDGQSSEDGTPVPAGDAGADSHDGEHDPALSDQLDEAYLARAKLVGRGEESTEVDATIVRLKQEIRRGPELQPGEFLSDGRYKLLERVGRGGFATVWSALDRKSGDVVAIKVLHGQWSQDKTRRDRFFRGARKMARLNHPNVVRVHVESAGHFGFHFFVMEYLAGGDLRRAVFEGRLDREGALQAVLGVGEGLQHAHDQGLVHRDVKPHNILLAADGAPKLTDFDLVRADDTTGGTRTGALGAFLYAAPEMLEDASTVDHRADVYGLGMTAVFAVHGKDLPAAAIYNRRAFLEGLDVGEAVGPVLRRCVARDADRRFGSVREFCAALGEALEVAETQAGSGENGGEPSAPDQEVERNIEEPLKQGSWEDPPRRTGPVPPLERQPELHKPRETFDSNEFVRRRIGLTETAPPRGRWGRYLGVVAAIATIVSCIIAVAVFLEGRSPKVTEEGAEASSDEPPPQSDTSPEPDISEDAPAADPGEPEATDPILDAPPTGESLGVRYTALANTDNPMEFVQLTGGEFTMGGRGGYASDSNYPRHRVTIPGFMIATREVTMGQFVECLGSGVCEWPPIEIGDCSKDADWMWFNPDMEDYPMSCVPWDEAREFAKWLGGELPTEAEWEYAARAGQSTMYSGSDDIDKVAWYESNSGGWDHPVGEKQANAWGLFDMSGNVREWCADDWHDGYEGAPADGRAWVDSPRGRTRVTRGGCAGCRARSCRSVSRNLAGPSESFHSVGFRVVLPIPEDEP